MQTLDDRGPNDLTKQIDKLEGQKKFLQAVCRRAGKQIKELTARLKHCENWKQEEVDKFVKKIYNASYEDRSIKCFK